MKKFVQLVVGDMLPPPAAAHPWINPYNSLAVAIIFASFLVIIQEEPLSVCLVNVFWYSKNTTQTMLIFLISYMYKNVKDGWTNQQINGHMDGC